MMRVSFTKFAEKQIIKLPTGIIRSLSYWIDTVVLLGIRETRRLSGYHDEPLKGTRKGQRSVRLNRSYRVIYIETNQNVELLIIEVNKHEY